MAWIKADAKAILAIHEHVITNNDRLSVTHNDYNTWTLNIRNVKMEDAGKYMCQVNTDPMKMQVSTEQFSKKKKKKFILFWKIKHF